MESTFGSVWFSYFYRWEIRRYVDLNTERGNYMQSSRKRCQKATAPNVIQLHFQGQIPSVSLPGRLTSVAVPAAVAVLLAAGGERRDVLAARLDAGDDAAPAVLPRGQLRPRRREEGQRAEAEGRRGGQHLSSNLAP